MVQRLDNFWHGGVLLEKKWDVVQLQFLPKHTALFNSTRPQHLTIPPSRDARHSPDEWFHHHFQNTAPADPHHDRKNEQWLACTPEGICASRRQSSPYTTRFGIGL